MNFNPPQPRVESILNFHRTEADPIVNRQECLTGLWINVALLSLAILGLVISR